MSSLSRIATKCRECPNRYSCDNKFMQLEAYLETPNISANISQNISESLAMPLMRETMKINDGHGNMVEVYKDDIEKQIYEGLYKHLGLNYGA